MLSLFSRDSIARPVPVAAAGVPMIAPPLDGGCQCATVRYRCTAAPFVVYTCHCRACQAMTSSAFATCAQVPAEALRLLRGVPNTYERVADDGDRLTIAFCSTCASALFIANAARPRLRTLLVGTLDRAQDLEVSAHIWTARKLPWVCLPPEHRVFAYGGDWRADYAADPSRLER